MDSNQRNNQVNNHMNNPVNNQVNNQMNNQVNNNLNNEQKNNDKKGRGSFYGILAIAIFIVMAVGATYAFFTATARSGDSSVSTRSATVSLEYISYGSAWSNDDLIPAPVNAVEYSVEFQNDTTEPSGKTNLNNTLCKDDDGNSICSIYEFQVRNPENSDQNINLNLITNSNGFENLYVMAYDLEVESANETTYNTVTNKETEGSNGHGDPIFKTSADDATENAIAVLAGTDKSNQELYGETPIYVNRNGVTKNLLKYTTEEGGATSIKPSIGLAVPKDTDEEKTILLADKNSTGNSLSVPGNGIKTFIVVLYVLNKENEDQTTADSAKDFFGTIEVTNAEGSEGGIFGSISAAANANLQSATPTPTTEPTPGP